MDKYDFKLINEVTKKNIFEGWYFKQTNENFSCSFIPGISTNNNDPQAFIQVVLKNKAFYFKFPLDDFSFTDDKIIIANNIFSLDGVLINLENENIKIEAALKYSDITPLKSSLYAPTIMGPFSYLSFMECVHGICSMHHNVNGNISINKQNYKFINGDGYIEKDSGSSFPRKYTWIQANSKEDSFFFSTAIIPFLKMKFNGTICVLKDKEEEIRFTTYYGVKITKSKENKQNRITLKQGHRKLEIIFIEPEGKSLKSPKNGEMVDEIEEDIRTDLEVIYYNKQKVKQYVYHNASIEKNE